MKSPICQKVNLPVLTVGSTLPGQDVRPGTDCPDLERFAVLLL